MAVAAAEAASDTAVADEIEPAEWDWKDGGGAGRALAALEGHFTCAVCSGFLEAPQTITLCGHTFCSGCIRGALEVRTNLRVYGFHGSMAML